jgi:hypothetical protein
MQKHTLKTMASSLEAEATGFTARQKTSATLPHGQRVQIPDR